MINAGGAAGGWSLAGGRGPPAGLGLVVRHR